MGPGRVRSETDFEGPRAAEGSTVEAVYKLLKNDIIAGVRPAKELLRIDKMRKIYGVGPTPLRETLQRLTAEGLVIAREGRGFQVAPLAVDEFEDLNVARTEIELAALRLSIEHGAESWEAEVVGATYMLEKADAQLAGSASEAIDRWEAANAKFHTALLAACPSRWLLHTRSNFTAKCERYRRAVMLADHRQRNSQLAKEHGDLSDAVLARDAETACRLLREHYARTVRNFRDHAARK